MINDFTFRRIKDRILIVNDFGKYCFIDGESFRQLVSSGTLENDSVRTELKEKYFLLDDEFELYDEELLGQYRDMKSYVFSGTALHIFVLTNTCNLNCVYCQARDAGSKDAGIMTLDVGKKAIDIAMQSPNRCLTFEFQGGEPLINFDVMRGMIEYSEAMKGNRDISYTLVSNLVLLNDEMIAFFEKYNVCVNTSLDGPECLHNHNRVAPNNDNFHTIISKLPLLKEAGICGGAIQTTTRESLKYPEEIVDTYVNNGLNGLFIRPLSPLGFAKSYWDRIGYSVEEFLTFYEIALGRIISYNMKGIDFPELTASYFLSKILNGYSHNYMELRSPCGAVFGQLCYYYDGNIYTCDEGRMVAEAGDKAFRVGDVFNSSYASIIESPVCKSVAVASLTESLPDCSDCVYQAYCGVCPVVNYASEKSIFPKGPRGYRCQINKGILDILFEKIYYDESGTNVEIFKKWVDRR